MNNNIKSTKQYADKIVDTDYKNSKNKNPFTQVAENAVKELSFTMRDGHIENNEGTKRLKTIKEGIEMNEALDKNLLDHQRGDYLHNNVNSKNFPNKNNPTVQRYKNFKEDKKFNEEFEKEYSDKTIEQDIRSKENKNRVAGKAPYENFTQSQIIVAEHAKNKAKKKLKALMTPVKRNNEVDDISEKISLLQLHKKEMEEKTEKLKKEFDKIIDRPVDKDLYRGLGSIDPRLKE
jgi:hypothetical protein|tara:strand:+ start:548 stop:1249 length:702 start_codon:yes stop_codon:yes gene_type:complete